MKKIILLLVALTSINSATAQIRVGRKAILPYEQTFDGTDLKLNGAGLREMLWIDLYAGGLYLQNKSKDPLEILDRDETMAIKLNIVSRLITEEKFAKSVRAGFEKATFGNTETLDGRINKFIRLFAEPIVKNDSFDIVYVKGVGLVSYKNDRKLGVIEGRDFKYAFFKIWLGDDPVDEDLKRGLLGLQ